MNKLAYIDEKLAELKKNGTYRILPVNYGPCKNVIDLNHRSVVNLSSNNYLGLAADPRVVKAAEKALKKYGAGAGAVR
ncbi:MAG: 8-amino-7-oxononanoate synthase, partial [Bacillota bacterium]|nr:8-amino-7-oxononanoate synthase [Bacillota bacterium]